MSVDDSARSQATLPNSEYSTRAGRPGEGAAAPVRTRRRRRWIWRTVLALLVLNLLSAVAVGTFVFHSAIQRTAPAGITPAEGGDALEATFANSRKEGGDWIAAVPHQRWSQRAADGVETIAYWFAAEQPTTRTVVLVHGHRSDASMMGAFGDFYRQQGFNVFIADARGHGMSGGNYIGFGYLEQADYLGWLNRIVSTVGNGAQILLHGVSMGGSTVLMLAGNKQLPAQVKAVIDDCGFTTATAEISHQLAKESGLPAFPVVNIASLESKLFAGYWFDDADALGAAARTKLPVFVIHGDADTYNPTSMGQQIYAAAGGPKQLWLVPGADHTQSFFLHRTEYEQRVQEFYGKYL
jgi:fermentation-respiration switch protein FrsA (DUF1100 family)